jgi:uncharacterized protein YdeI (YjbR/CyaY-like superfamily)
MEITETLYVTDRKQWRSWLAKNHASANEIWLIYYKVNSDKPRIPYNDAVEEALCYGWIDSTVKKLDIDRFVQRFSPRRKNSKLSVMNKERIWRLMENGKMTAFGLEKIKHHLAEYNSKDTDTPEIKVFKIPADILDELKTDTIVWDNFSKFPDSYKRIRIGWIDGARIRPVEFQKRLKYFIKMTSKNKMFGMVQ